eukprot:TRINITY_DN18562_c0_g1_i1.p1 TRINITY_DN18562_c0_g1~~TRINITY_DN18562_c0_g1_i1.p1  ORF type:complete len:1418 (+),score=391.76 TRINITY_DN18562_c0_g1_i1:95-4348(+)
MSSSFGATNVVVAVRARPLTHQEEERGAEELTLLMDKNTNTTTLVDWSTGSKKKFRFDYNYWSIGDADDAEFANQDRIYTELGEQQLQHALSGYNACIFAYGQTSSGKTYTMMGPPSCTDHTTFNFHTGLIPRLSHGLFERIRAASGSQMVSFRVEMSFYEIYNEKVYCLLEPTSETLRPREDPKTGPYIENLLAVEVHHYLQIAELLKLGNRTRHTGRTKMNERSSRSHAVLCLTITKSEWNKETGDSTDFVSKVNLVDLAGSERTAKAGTEGDRFKEGININKSLSALGMVIKKLADLNDPSVVSDGNYVPYRDSTLTWLLKDNLGGNSRTVMLATLSPCRLNFDETFTTLRYAERVKMIRNAPTINKRMSNRKLIRELKAQVKALMDELSGQPKRATYLTRGGGILAHSPLFVRNDAKQNEPVLWFVPDGFSVICAYDAASHQDDDSPSRPNSARQAPSAKEGGDDIGGAAVTGLPMSRRSSIGYVATGSGHKPQPKMLRKVPSYLQPTLSAAYKDTGMAAQLRDVDADELGKDFAHTVAPSHSGNHAAPQSLKGRKASLPGSALDLDTYPERTTSPVLAASNHAPAKRQASLRRKSSTPSLPKRSSSSTGNKRRPSIAKALNTADKKIASTSPADEPHVPLLSLPDSAGAAADLAAVQVVTSPLLGSEEDEGGSSFNNSFSGQGGALRFRQSTHEGASSMASGSGQQPPPNRQPTNTAEDLKALFSQMAELAAGGGGDTPRAPKFPIMAGLDGSVCQLGLPGLAKAAHPHVALHRIAATDEVRIVSTGTEPVAINDERLAPYDVVTLPARCDITIGTLPPIRYANPALIDETEEAAAAGLSNSNMSFATWQRRNTEKLHIDAQDHSGDAEDDKSPTAAETAPSGTERDASELSSPKQPAELAAAQQTIFVQGEQIVELEGHVDRMRAENRAMERLAEKMKAKEHSALEELAAARKELAELRMLHNATASPAAVTERTGTPGGVTQHTGSPATSLPHNASPTRGGADDVGANGTPPADELQKVALEARREQEMRLGELALEKEKLQNQLESISNKLVTGETERRELEESLRRMDIERKEERKEMAQRTVSYEEAQAAQRLIQSEMSTKYRQLDILKAQIGDKKHAARQLQDSYNERLSDLEREAWEKHRAIKELQAEEQEMTSRVVQLKQEEERIVAKMTKYKRAKEDQMDSTELNSVDVYEFIGGLRLDDIMFRTKGIQLSRQSRTPIWLRFTPSALLVYNADSYRTSMPPAHRTRAASPAGRNLTGRSTALGSGLGGVTGGYASDPSVKALKELPYDRVVSFKQVDKEVIQISSQGFSSDISILCDNKQKRTSIIKLLMLKTKGVILSMHNGVEDGDTPPLPAGKSTIDSDTLARLSPRGYHPNAPPGLPIPSRRESDAPAFPSYAPHSHAV